MTLGLQLVMKTLEDELYIVIIYSFGEMFVLHVHAIPTYRVY